MKQRQTLNSSRKLKLIMSLKEEDKILCWYHKINKNDVHDQNKWVKRRTIAGTRGRLKVNKWENGVEYTWDLLGNCHQKMFLLQKPMCCSMNRNRYDVPGCNTSFRKMTKTLLCSHFQFRHDKPPVSNYFLI